MKPGQYKFRELFDNQEISHILIPELQRDYVWGKQQLENSLENGLLQTLYNSFIEYKTENKKIEYSVLNFDNNDSEVFKTYINDEFKKLYKDVKLSDSIGFLYAYHDSSYPDKFFLIDGQQRFTTLFLTLLALTTFDQNLKDEFKILCLDKNKNPRLCYKVRRKTEIFLNHFTAWALNQNFNDIRSKSLDDFKNLITENFWYNEENKNDVTISSIIQNFYYVSNFIEKNAIEKSEFWQYLLDYVCFWYFDTSVSKQGEQLFISMNSRGMSSSTQELDKANLLKKITEKEDKLNWGKEWEDWQQFFWELRKKNEINANADRGLSLFLRVIRDIEPNKDGKEFLEAIRNYYNGIQILKSQIEIIPSFDFTEKSNLWSGLFFGYDYNQSKNYNRDIDLKKEDKDEDDAKRKAFTDMFGSLGKRLYVYGILYYAKKNRTNFNQVDFIRFARIYRNLLLNSDIKYIHYQPIINNIKNFIDKVNGNVLDIVQVFNDFSPLNGTQIDEEQTKGKIKTDFPDAETILNEIEDFDGAKGRARHIYSLFEEKQRNRLNLETGFAKFKIVASYGKTLKDYRDTDLLELYIINDEDDDMFFRKNQERLKFNDPNEEAFQLWKSKPFQEVMKNAIELDISEKGKETFLQKHIDEKLVKIFEALNIDSKDKIPSITEFYKQYFIYYIVYRKIYDEKCNKNCPLNIGKYNGYKEEYIKKRKRMFDDNGVIEFYHDRYFGFYSQYALPIHIMKNKDDREQWIEKLWEYYLNCKTQN